MAAFTIAVTLVGVTVLDPWYGLALTVILPVYVVTLRWYLRAGPRVYLAERAVMSGRAQQLLESQRGYATVLGPPCPAAACPLAATSGFSRGLPPPGNAAFPE